MDFRNLFFVLFFTVILASCHSSGTTLFESLPSGKTHVEFSNDLDSSKSYKALYFFYYYNGGGVATGDINNDGLPDIYFTANNKGGNKLYLNKGNFEFEDITENAGVAGTADWCTGVTMADVNGDGFLDIYVSAISNIYKLQGRNQLFINNNGNGTFTEMGAAYGLDISSYANQASFFDFDHDGDLDCYILNQSFKPAENIVDTSHRRNPDPNSGDRFFRNDISVNGRFTDITSQAGIYQSSLGYGLGISVADINNDGWEDIYIGNDFHENDYYYINKGDGSFTESSAAHFNHFSRFSMGNDIADYDNDGQLDIFTADMLPNEEQVLKTYGSGEALDIYNYIITRNGFQPQFSRNSLQHNNGNGNSFTELALQKGVAATDWSWCPLFADFDNDGNKDLFISAGIVKRTVDLDYVKFLSDLKVPPGTDPKDTYNKALAKMPDGIAHNVVFQNDGNGNFTDKSREWGLMEEKGYFTGAACADFDLDGKLDLVVNSVNQKARLFRNTNKAQKHFLSVKLVGNTKNSKGIGAKAYLFNKGSFQYQQLMTTRGFQSSSEPAFHFGTDSTSTIDSLLIVWPDSGKQMIRNIKSDQVLIAEQKKAGAEWNGNLYKKPEAPLFTDISERIQLGWNHTENDFNDFDKQFLIPHKESTRGPHIAIADIDKDGLDDIYVCAAKGMTGGLFRQNKEGKWIASTTTLFSQAVPADEVDALFFDANKDGFPDLYIVTAGNELENGNPELADKLYINDKKGGFIKAPLPDMFVNKSCVVSADVDKDGDMDLFAGTLCSAGSFGVTPSSYLLINDGTGKFSIAPSKYISLESVGMVTSALFTDINQDGWPDLVVAGEWMPLKIFINNKGGFNSQDIPYSSGLWQSLLACDLNGDGQMDILAGNWGKNSKLYSGKNGPLKLYVKDFDENGSVEQIMAYTIDGKEYSFLPKDELEKALPYLKKQYLTYSSAAGKTVQELLGVSLKGSRELNAEVLASSLFWNEGNGRFKRSDLPEDWQTAPVFSLATIPESKNPSVLAAGNFYGVTPYEGRYDGLYPTLFSFSKNNNTFTKGNIQWQMAAEIRDMKWLKHAKEGNILVLARNNGPLVFLKQQQ